MFNSIQFCDIVYSVQDRAEMPKDVLDWPTGLFHCHLTSSFKMPNWAAFSEGTIYKMHF